VAVEFGVLLQGEVQAARWDEHEDEVGGLDVGKIGVGAAGEFLDVAADGEGVFAEGAADWDSAGELEKRS